MKEGDPSKAEIWLNRYIEQKAVETSHMAAQTTVADDPIVDEAVFFDYLANEPNPEDGMDDPPDAEPPHHGD